MAKERTLKIVIAGDADKLNKELRKSEGHLDRFGKQTRLTASVSSKGFSAIRAGATGAAAGLAGLVLAGKSVVDANIEAEKSQARLQAQLKASGISYANHRKEIEAVIQKHSQLAGLDDEDLQDAFTAIVRSTGDVDKSLRLVGLASDIARAKQIDVAKAGELVAKVAGGNTGILKRYGVVVKDGATAQEALAAAQKKFGGQAEAYGKTTAGSVDRANVAFENLQETIGAALAPAVADVSDKVADFVNEMSAGTGQGGRFVDTLKDIWTEAKPIVMWLGRAAKNVASFTSEHPGVARLAAAVVGVGVALRGIKFVGAITGFNTLLSVGRSVTKKLVGTFGSRGAAAGAAFAAESQAGMAAGGKGGWGKTGRSIGSKVGRGMVLGLVASIPFLIDEVYDAMSPLWERISNKIGNLLKGVPLVGGLLGDVFGRDKGASKVKGTKIPTISLGGATGGMVPGSGRGDTVPAMLEPGEFVMQRKVVDKFGPTFFAGLNAGGVQHFMSGGQVAGLARGAGFSGNSLITALAIAKGESGWREGASNRNTDGSVDRGLWQINSVHGGLSTFDPAANARAAYKISGGGRNWSPWVVFQKGLHRKYLDDARAAVGSSGGSSSGGSSTSSASDIREARTAAQERSGSRLVNSLVKKFGGGSTGFTRSLKLAGIRGQVIENKDTEFSQAERRFGQSEEDLGTSAGRAQRLSELMELKKLKVAQAARMRKRAQLLKRSIGKLTALLRRGRKARDRAKGAKRAKINERLRSYDDKLTDLKAELRALGFAIADTELDIGDIDKEITDTANTPNTEPEQVDTPSTLDRVGQAISDIDLQERAGLLSPDAASAQRIATLQGALAGQFGGFTDARQQWELMGQLRDAQQAQVDAQKEATQAANDLADQMRGLRDEVAKSNAIAKSEIAVGLREARRAIGDMLAGQLGTRVGARAALPGTGQLSRL